MAKGAWAKGACISIFMTVGKSKTTVGKSGELIRLGSWVRFFRGSFGPGSFGLDSFGPGPIGSGSFGHFEKFLLLRLLLVEAPFAEAPLARL